MEMPVSCFGGCEGNEEEEEEEGSLEDRPVSGPD